MPTQDNIVIKLEKVEKEQTTKSGIIITSSASQHDMPDQGKVAAVGAGRILNNGTRLEPLVKVGDEVIFNKFAGTKISSNNDEYLIIKENDILAIVK